MERHANTSCLLELRVRCHSCQQKLWDVVSAIVGLYDVAIESQSGDRYTVRITGEVDPRVLLAVLSRCEGHMKVLSCRIAHPKMRPLSRDHPRDCSYSSNYGGMHQITNGGYNDYRLNDPYYYESNYLQYPRSRYEFDHQPSYFNNFTAPLPPATYVPSYRPQEYITPYDEYEGMSSFGNCNIM